MIKKQFKIISVVAIINILSGCSVISSNQRLSDIEEGLKQVQLEEEQYKSEHGDVVAYMQEHKLEKLLFVETNLNYEKNALYVLPRGYLTQNLGNGRYMYMYKTCTHTKGGYCINYDYRNLLLTGLSNTDLIPSNETIRTSSQLVEFTGIYKYESISGALETIPSFNVFGKKGSWEINAIWKKKNKLLLEKNILLTNYPFLKDDDK